MAENIKMVEKPFGIEEFNLLFDAAMERDWEKVISLYKEYPSSACTAKLTKSEQTALHIIIAIYITNRDDSSYHLKCINKMVKSIPGPDEDSVVRVLSLKDVKGNTPLHLAATLGIDSVCNNILGGDGRRWKLIEQRNNENETPLFLAGHHNKIDTFFNLCKIYKRNVVPPIQARPEAESTFWSPFRGKDGKTVLHSAISGQSYKLAFQIIKHYPELVDKVNVDGESPLHVLANQPNSFESSSQLRLYDNIFYKCIYVEKLRKENYDDDTKENSSVTKEKLRNDATKENSSFSKEKLQNDATKENSSVTKSETRYPKNYETMADLFELVREIICSFLGYRSSSSRNNDEENQLNIKNKPDEEESEYNQYPGNYATCIGLFKLGMMFLMIIIGVGYSKIKKMREKKERHTWATQIMTEMIKLETSYKYISTGQDPTQGLPTDRNTFAPPTDAPPEDSDTEANSTKVNTSEIEDKKVENGSAANKKLYQKEEKYLIGLQEVTKDLNTEKITALLSIEKEQRNGVKRGATPLLIAAKTGIKEMVKDIMDKVPVAIQDLDENDKNALLLAIEYRQTRVLKYLIKRDLPDFVLQQVDNEGNGARHLAGLFRTNNPWKLPGAALQMHGEVTWFKYVKQSLPPRRFVHYNKKGETPRNVFNATHEELSKAGTEWLIKTSESCSVVAALIATVAFATSATVPGGVDQQSGNPTLVDKPLFNVFSMASLVALCFSLTSLVFFLAIITSRCQVWDFKKNLPRKLLMGLSTLFTSIAAIVVTFCAGHFFVLRQNLKYAALPIYTVTSVPVTIFAFAQLPLYFDLIQAVFAQVPVRNFKVYYH